MSYSITGTTIRLTRGDTLPVEVTIYEADGKTEYEPQTGDSVRFALKRAAMTPGNKEFVDQTPLILKPIPTDTLLLQLDPEDTAGLPFGNYKYDLELTFANGAVCTFIANSDFILTPEVH